MGEIIHLNEEEVKSQLSEMVRETVEKTLNHLLDAEADEITRAHKYERTDERVDTRAGHYHRKLVTKAGTVDIKVPKLRKLPFETGIIERYKRREESVEECTRRANRRQGQAAARGSGCLVRTPTGYEAPSSKGIVCTRGFFDQMCEKILT